MADKPFGSGSCVCGAVTYSVHGEPVRMGQCHCKDCQRASGTGHMSLAFFNEDDVKISGEFAEYSSTAESGNINTRAFCPTCGGRLFGRNSARAGVKAIAVGSFDDSSWFKPQAVVYCKDQPKWDLTDDESAKFDKMPPPA